MGTQVPVPKGAQPPPIFGPYLLWSKRGMNQDATCYGARPQPRWLCVRWEPSPLPQKGQSLAHFSTHDYCGQTAAWIKMPIRTEVGLVLRDIVFDVDPATPRKKAHPNFGPCLLWPNGWMGEDAAWYGRRPRPRPHCTRRDPSSRKRGTVAPLFSAHVYCGHGRPSQLLLSSCCFYYLTLEVQHSTACYQVNAVYFPIHRDILETTDCI